ncbi:thioredoxin [Acetivibrio sp. MSJd-27]|jgi:thioredoxin|uniref:thioredoxin n=1 Tax=Acetivibrio sp. MSJd-27 TaxID=2841523 RepID=UPI0015ADED46|nr:thioredoxin [Acetivibrio sp. MSJd-27]MBU5450029.1 thioredoxin [Acetivibrio sp. MSJd-27]
MDILNITKHNYQKEIHEAKETVLLDFWAPWCGPCRMVSPIVDEVAREATDRVKIGKVNVDEQPELAESFRVMSIPTLIVMQDGEIVEQKVGVQNKEAILKMLEFDEE